MFNRRRVLVVDGSRYFNGSIWHTLIPESEFELVGLARNTEEAVEMVTSLSPDIVLVDLSHSEMRGVQAILSLNTAQSAIPIIAFTPMSSDEYTQAALKAGAAACFPKSDMAEALLHTIWELIPDQLPVSGTS